MSGNTLFSSSAHAKRSSNGEQSAAKKAMKLMKSTFNQANIKSSISETWDTINDFIKTTSEDIQKATKSTSSAVKYPKRSTRKKRQSDKKYIHTAESSSGKSSRNNMQLVSAKGRREIFKKAAKPLSFREVNKRTIGVLRQFLSRSQHLTELILAKVNLTDEVDLDLARPNANSKLSSSSKASSTLNSRPLSTRAKILRADIICNEFTCMDAESFIDALFT